MCDFQHEECMYVAQHHYINTSHIHIMFAFFKYSIPQVNLFKGQQIITN